MPSPFDPVEEPVSAGNPFDPEPRPRPQRQSASADGGFRDPKQPGYTFFSTGHVIRDSDKKVWDPSTKSWYYMTEHGMSPEFGKASIPDQDDTRLDTLNLLRKIGSPVIPSQSQAQPQPQQQAQEPGRIGAAEDLVKQLWGKGKATGQKVTAATLHLIGGIQEEAGNLGIGLKKLASGQASTLTPDEARAIATAQAGGWQSAAALHALALAPKWQREAAQTTKGAAGSLYQKGVESAAVEPRTAAGKVGAFIGGLAPHLTPLAPLTMAAEAGETGYRTALQEGAENETAILSGIAQAGIAGTLGSINKIGQLSKGGLKAVEPVLSKYPRLWSLLNKEVESGASGPVTRWLGNLVRGSAKTSAEFAAGGMGMRAISEAARPQGGSPLNAALEPSEIGKDILTGAAFHALPEIVRAATGPAREAFMERLQRSRELRGVGKGPSPEERLAAIKEAERAQAEEHAREAEAAKPKPEIPTEEQPEEIQPGLPREAPAGVSEGLRPPEGEEKVAPSDEYAKFTKELDDLDNGIYAPTPAAEEPIAEARTGQERRIAEEPIDIERRSIERRQETKKSIEAEKRPEDMTQAELAEEVGRLRSERMLDSKVPDMANERAFNATYQEGDPVASLDVRGLKATNKFGQHIGDEFLIDVFSRLNKIAKEEGAFAAHRSGDEGLVTHSDPAVLNRVIERTNQDLLKNPFRFVDERTGKKTEIKGEFHYGTATSPEAADRAMAAAKVAKAQPPVQPTAPGRTEGVAPAVPGREPAPQARPEVLAAREQQRTEREAIKNSGLTKEERREAYKGITKLDTILRNESYPSTTEEATKVADMAASKVLPKGEKAAAQVKLAEGMKAGTFPQFSDMKLKADGTPDMGAFLQALQAGFTGDGVMNADGSKVVIPPLMSTDAEGAVQSVRRDLSAIERTVGRIGSTSHVYTGTWSLGTDGEKGHRTIGALEGTSNPATDKHLALASSFGNTVHVSQHLIDTLTKYAIPNNHFRLLKELKPTNEYWSKAVKEYDATKESYKKNRSVATKIAFEIAKEHVADAAKVVNSHLREIYSDPSYGDARVMAYADATRGGKESPEWLERLMNKSEKGAALEITNQMNEIKRALSEAGIPVREDYGVPHTIKAWMKGTDFKRVYDPETGKINPESLEFRHRSDQSILTMPDAYGMIEDYIPHTMSLIAKRNVANKWDYVARELESTAPRLSEQIKQDMSSYTKGEGAVHEWMDKINSWFANYLVGYRTATAVKHLAKYPIELANASPIKSAMGWLEFKREVAKNPELKRIMDEMTRAAKGPRYNAYPDLGTGEDVTGVAKGVGQKIAASSHSPMQPIEGALRSNTFRMDLLGNIKKGMSPKDAVADAVFRSILVNFQASDKPMIMRSSLGRSIFFLQQTVWKIMEVNARAAADAARGVKRGVETAITGEKLSAEEKGRYSQAARQMAALVAMYYIGKQTNTKLFDWISESPSIVKALVTKPLLMMTKNAVAKAKGEETDWHYNPTDELLSGISATQAFQNIEKSAKEYGFGTKGFWLNLTPESFKDIALEPSKYQQQKTGTGAEALFRRVTGLTKMEEEEEAKEKMLKKTQKKQESKSEKLVQRLRNPLDVITPTVQESDTSPFDKE